MKSEVMKISFVFYKYFDQFPKFLYGYSSMSLLFMYSIIFQCNKYAKEVERKKRTNKQTAISEAKYQYLT